MRRFIIYKWGKLKRWRQNFVTFTRLLDLFKNNNKKNILYFIPDFLKGEQECKTSLSCPVAAAYFTRPDQPIKHEHPWKVMRDLG